MSTSNPPRRAQPKVPASPDALEPTVDENPLPHYALPVVLTAFAAGLLLGTRSGRCLTRSVVRAGLTVVKPALVIGGLLKLRELSTSHPDSSPTPPLP